MLRKAAARRSAKMRQDLIERRRKPHMVNSIGRTRARKPMVSERPMNIVNQLISAMD